MLWSVHRWESHTQMGSIFRFTWNVYNLQTSCTETLSQNRFWVYLPKNSFHFPHFQAVWALSEIDWRIIRLDPKWAENSDAPLITVMSSHGEKSGNTQIWESNLCLVVITETILSDLRASSLTLGATSDQITLHNLDWNQVDLEPSHHRREHGWILHCHVHITLASLDSWPTQRLPQICVFLSDHITRNNWKYRDRIQGERTESISAAVRI